MDQRGQGSQGTELFPAPDIPNVESPTPDTPPQYQAFAHLYKEEYTHKLTAHLHLNILKKSNDTDLILKQHNNCLPMSFFGLGDCIGPGSGHSDDTFSRTLPQSFPDSLGLLQPT